MATEKIYIVEEDLAAVNRYNQLKEIGKKIIPDKFPQNNRFSEAEAKLGETILAKAIHDTNPPVWASYFEHIVIASKLGKEIAFSALQKGVAIDPYKVEFLLHLHDLGRIVTPGAYLRNDFIGDRLLFEMGVPKALLKDLPSTQKLMAVASTMDLDPEQLTFKKALTKTQEKIADEYFNSQTETQRIINLADNLGKRGPDALFNTEMFLKYLKSQEARYDQTSDWPSINWALPRRQAGAVLQADVIEKTVRWLSKKGVDLNEIHQRLENYTPQFIITHPYSENSKEESALLKLLGNRQFKNEDIQRRGGEPLVTILHPDGHVFTSFIPK